MVAQSGVCDTCAGSPCGRSAGVSTINARLSAVKTYATLASCAGTIPATELALIQTVSGYWGNEAHRIDQNRVMGGQPTRVGLKKAEPARFTREQATALKRIPGESPQSHRDRVIMCLLLDHGLRCSELAGIQAAHVDLARARVRFYRPKVHRTQTHQLTPDTHQAIEAYLNLGIALDGPLLWSSCKDGSLSGPGMSTRSITRRVQALGTAIGVEGRGRSGRQRGHHPGD